MRIGILGSGLMGSKLGTILARAGHEVVFSSNRLSKAPLASVVRDKTPARASVSLALPGGSVSLHSPMICHPTAIASGVGWQVLTESGLPERAA
jgi:hypothetical protein